MMGMQKDLKIGVLGKSRSAREIKQGVYIGGSSKCRVSSLGSINFLHGIRFAHKISLHITTSFALGFRFPLP